MRKMIDSVKIILPTLFLMCGVCYGLYVYSGYEKGQREYAELSDEYTKLIVESESEGRTPVKEDRNDSGEDVMPDSGTQWPLLRP